MKTLRYLHLVIGLATLLAGLFNSIPFFTQNAPINPIGLLAILTGLINLQHFSLEGMPHAGPRGAIALLSSVLLVISACIPFSTLLISSWFFNWNIWALSAGVVGVCLYALLPLTRDLGSLRKRIPAPSKPKASGKANDKRESGTVKWFNTTKGFGFISRDSGSDVFVHFRGIQGDGHRFLQEGQRVTYIVAKREKGLQAEEVSIID